MAKALVYILISIAKLKHGAKQICVVV